MTGKIASTPLEEAQQYLVAGKYEDAMRLFTPIFNAEPVNRKARLGLATSMLGAQRYEEMIDFVTKTGGPDCLELVVNTATVLRQLKRSDDEYATLKESLRYTVAGQTQHFRLLATRAEEREDWAVLHATLALLRTECPNDLNILQGLFRVTVRLKRYDDALLFGRRCLDLVDKDSQAITHSLLSDTLKSVGDTAGAIKHAKQAVKLSDELYLRSNTAMTMQYAYGVTLDDFYRETRDFEHKATITPLRRHPPLTPGKARSGLHIGFVSGDFIGHSLTALLLAIFQKFKAVGPQHSYTIYSNKPVAEKDGFSALYALTVTTWRDIHELSHDAVAELIRTDGVDVLIDISGHTANNRLPVFTQRPAPIQMGWVSGMMSPPGLDCIPYFLVDADIIPPGQECPTLIPVVSSYVYTPIANTPGIKPELPLTRNGYVTFGNFNNPCKLNTEVISTWLEILKRLPKSRLHTKIYGGITADWFREMAKAAKIDVTRITFIENLPRTDDVMAYYTNTIDIALDTWPCAGMLTSLESMWMGVPVITLRGDTFLHRQTDSILRKLKLPEFGADTPAEFITRAVTLAKNPERLQTFRTTIRDAMSASVIREPRVIADSVLKGIVAAWEHRCSVETAISGLVAPGVPI